MIDRLGLLAYLGSKLMQITQLRSAKRFKCKEINAQAMPKHIQALLTPQLGLLEEPEGRGLFGQ